jgi:hypothetical protein
MPMLKEIVVRGHFVPILFMLYVHDYRWRVLAMAYSSDAFKWKQLFLSRLFGRKQKCSACFTNILGFLKPCFVAKLYANLITLRI